MGTKKVFAVFLQFFVIFPQKRGMKEVEIIN